MSLYLTQLKWELQKLFARGRTRMGFVAFVVLELLLLLLIHFRPVYLAIRVQIRHSGIPFAGAFSGPTVAAFMMGHTMTVLGTAFIALAAGECIAKEAEDGTLRTTFCRPVSRKRLFGQKLIACAIHACLVTWFVGASALALGLLFHGPGFMVLWSFKENLSATFDFWPGLGRYALSLVFLNLSVLSVAALAFSLSCLDIKPAAATIVTLGFFLADDALRNVPQFSSVRPYFVMSHIVSWLRVYDDPVPWSMLAGNYLVLLLADALVVAIGWTQFRKREFKP